MKKSAPISNLRTGLRHRSALAVLAAVLLVPAPARAEKLKPQSLETFRKYARLTEARVEKEAQSADAFLWVDTLPAARRAEALALLRRGEVHVAELRTLENGKPIRDDDSLIHHWVGTVFVPGVTMPQALALIQDYDRHAEYFKPDVVTSRIVSRNGNDIRTQVRFYKKKVIGVTLDTDHDIHDVPLDAKRMWFRTVTTRVQQVEHPGTPKEKLLPAGDDDGYLWQLYTWWRLEERDGGTYIQCESATLTRDIPTGLGWLIGPFVKGVPKESLLFTLGTTRRLLMAQAAASSK